jgi:hypothetical protein
LGRCLVFLQQFGKAHCAFRQQVLRYTEDGDPVHNVRCNLCDEKPNIIGTRFVCMTCADVDLCATCMQKYPDEQKLRMCQNHKFLEVGGSLSHSKDSESTKESSQHVQEWLRGLLKHYSELPEQ